MRQLKNLKKSLLLTSFKALTNPNYSRQILKIVFGMTTIVFTVAYVAGNFVVTQPEAAQKKELKPTQPPLATDNRLPERDATAEASARVQLDRAMRLAKNSRFQDAITEANKIPSDSLSYQQAQQLISQWSEQMLRADAEQRDIQQRLKAEHESNRQHLQLAQQALTQNDWSTALQEAEQISNNPLLKQQRDDIIQEAEPYEHEQRAQRFLEQGELENAVYEANRLPKVAPWKEKNKIILEHVSQRLADKRVAGEWNKRCRALTKDNISRCPNLDDLRGIVEMLPPPRWLPKLIASSRKARR